MSTIADARRFEWCRIKCLDAKALFEPAEEQLDLPVLPISRGDRWLVACFGLRYYRLLLGVLDWSAAAPTITPVTARDGPAEFGL